MNVHIAVLLLMIYGIGNLAIGFFMGKYHERLGWNMLIEKGKT
jgi:hypothetical protein